MPAAVAAYISTATLTAASVVTAAQITAMTYAAFAVGSVAVGNYQRRKAKARAVGAFNASLEDRLVTTRTTMGARSRCYGRVRNVDGVLFHATRGTNKEFYTLFIAVAGHEIDGFETVYFDDDPLTLDANGWVQNAPYAKPNNISTQTTVTLNGSGGFVLSASYVAGTSSAVYSASGDGGEVPVTTTEGAGTITLSGGPPGQVVRVNYQQATTESKARVRFYTGAAGQNVGTVLAPLFPGLVTTDHRFAGIAGLLVDLEFDPDVYPGGVPPISATFRGARVLDPRTSTTAWTENPALIARDWALYAYGGGCAAGDLVAASFNTAANVCDTSTTITLPSGPTTMPAFTCGIVAKLGEDDPWQVFQEIVETMAGKTGWPGGQLRVVAGSYRAPVATITEDWLSGKNEIQIIPEPPVDEAVNIYRAQIADKAQAFAAVQAPEVRAATFISADGRELPREITLGGVTDTAHAQHVCSIMLRDARNALSVVLPLNLRGFQLELFDVVAVTLPTFGWVAKTFEIVDWAFSLSGGVVVTLKETAAAIYTPDSLFAVLDVTPNTALPNPLVVPAFGAITATSAAAALQDGSAQTRLQLTWPAVADQAVSGSGSIEIQYWPAATALPAGDWLAAPTVPGNATTTTINGLRAGVVYLLRARYMNALGVHGNWGPQAVHRVAEVLPAEFAATRVWQWSAGTVDGWTASGATLTAAPGSLTITSTGTDPALRITGLSINGAQNPRVRMRVRRLAGSGWDGLLFYTTAGHGESGGFFKSVPNLLPIGPFMILEWDMSQLTAGGVDWTANNITGLRFDLGSASGDSFQIDWVAVGYIGPATDGAVWGANISGVPDNVLNATADLTLVADGLVQISGNSATKTGATSAWDASFRSAQGYVGGCYAEVITTAANTEWAFGINSATDVTNANRDTIDYAMSGTAAGVLRFYQSGGTPAQTSTYAAGDVLAIKYDGYRVEYIKNGVVLRTEFPNSALATASFFLDSSLFTPGASLRSIRFLPQTKHGAVWGATLEGQPADSALLNSYQIIGQNLLPESDQMVRVMFAAAGQISSSGLSLLVHNGAAIVGPGDLQAEAPSYQLLGDRSKLTFLRQDNRHTGSVATEADPLGNTIAAQSPYLFTVPVKPNDRMAVALDGSGHRCYWRVAVLFITATGTQPYDWARGNIVAPNATVTAQLSALQRSEAVFVVPPAAATAQVFAWKFNTVAGQTNSYLFFGRPQLEVVAANAQNASPYSSGPVGAIGTDQLSEAAATDIVEFYDAAGYYAANFA